MIVLDDKQIRPLLDYPTVIRLMQAAFAADTLGQVQLMPVIGQEIAQYDARWGVKAGYLKLEFDGARFEVMGLKQGWFSSANATRGLASHAATMLIADPRTGAPIAILAANAITEMRTAAAGALAAKFLAPARLRTVGLIGAGEQGWAQLEALSHVREFERVQIWSRRQEAASALVAKARRSGWEACACLTVQDAVCDADIIITTTPATSPIVHSAWIKDGVHINAIGSDAPDKRELDSSLIQRCVLVADKRVQSLSIGEMRAPIADGTVTAAHIRAELGELAAGRQTIARQSSDVTVFDSSGVSFQDLAVAGFVIAKYALGKSAKAAASGSLAG